jgi:DNA-binding CsgD family transcriptional regulator
MKNDRHAGEEFDYPNTGGETGVYDRVEVMPERPMQESNDLLVVAAQPHEAPCNTPDGDREAARGYIACTVRVRHEKLTCGPSVTRELFGSPDSAAGGCTGAGYELLIKCLRTGNIHGRRMVFVDDGPDICQLLEDLCPLQRNIEPAPTAYRSLSPRQVGVLQMIARGMSNKCIARSLGIAPETVKTHAKNILIKLEARTRAQAVARAEAFGLL